jgi:hypothetical protein
MSRHLKVFQTLLLHQNQRSATITLIATQLLFGLVMFSGKAWSDWINMSLHTHLLLGLVVFLVLAVLALVYGA